MGTELKQQYNIMKKDADNVAYPKPKKTTTNITPEFSFLKGYMQVQQKDAAKVRDRIMKELNLNSRPSWLRRLYGNTVPKVTEATAIEEILAEYGIKDVWGVHDEHEES